MGLPSPVLPHTTWELTRRCVGRRFLLRPDRDLTQAFLYCLALCANKYGIQVHCLVIMMNHFHVCLTDPGAKRVELTIELHALLARCIKALRGSRHAPLEGPIWEPSEQTGRAMLLSEEAFVEACSYAIANPVAAGLVPKASDWIGFRSMPSDLRGREITVARPACLPIDKPAAFPATATVRFVMPEHMQQRTAQVVEAIERRVREREHQARLDSTKSKSFPTAQQLLRVDPSDAPKTPRKRGLAPMLRAANAAVMRVARRQLVEWRRAYRRAFEAFRSGRRKVEWPAGTWYYAKYAGVQVAPADRAVLGVG